MGRCKGPSHRRHCGHVALYVKEPSPTPYTPTFHIHTFQLNSLNFSPPANALSCPNDVERVVKANGSQHRGKCSTCELCGKILASAASLEIHTNSQHTKLRKYPCPSCSRVYYDPSQRTKCSNSHRMTFICPEDDCNYANPLKDSMKKHIKGRHRHRIAEAHDLAPVQFESASPPPFLSVVVEPSKLEYQPSDSEVASEGVNSDLSAAVADLALCENNEGPVAFEAGDAIDDAVYGMTSPFDNPASIPSYMLLPDASDYFWSSFCAETPPVDAAPF